MQRAVNWLGVAGSISVFLLIAVSFFVPWWQVTVGSPNTSFSQFSVSPLNMNVNFMGQAFTVPLMIVINISVILALLTSAIAMLIYAVNPTKSYAKRLLGFSYRKPLYVLIIFIVGLVASILLIKSVVGLDVPFVGSLNVDTSGSFFQSVLGGITITNVWLTASFQYPFYLAIVAVALCIAARLYNKKVLTSTVTPNGQVSPQPASPALLTKLEN
jgi:hypothetical protein